jgi:hypothetical protein
MDLQLDVRTNLQLQEIAKKQGREIIDILKDAIAEYVLKYSQEEEFTEDVRQVIQEHQWLIDELDKR